MSGINPLVILLMMMLMRGRQPFSLRGQVVNILGLAGHIWLCPVILLCLLNVLNVNCISSRDIQKQAGAAWTWPTVADL